ncbi:MAG: hypothetical protein HY459_03330 [Parcubacteria group bacterium]|nr:hypothetical protein [Parcubacteria group bacterium]
MTEHSFVALKELLSLSKESGKKTISLSREVLVEKVVRTKLPKRLLKRVRSVRIHTEVVELTVLGVTTASELTWRTEALLAALKRETKIVPPVTALRVRTL